MEFFEAADLDEDGAVEFEEYLQAALAYSEEEGEEAAEHSDDEEEGEK